jgi:Ser/Thr protein kinase RdoA (MazF antagonist)
LILDFDDSAIGPLIYDLSCYIFYWTMDGNKLDTEILKLIIKEYVKGRGFELSKEEKDQFVPYYYMHALNMIYFHVSPIIEKNGRMEESLKEISNYIGVLNDMTEFIKEKNIFEL